MYDIDINEVMRYMGYRNQAVDAEMKERISGIAEKCRAASRPRYVYSVFDIERCGKGIALAGTSVLLKGENIRRHLLKSEKCAVVAVTLGAETEREIYTYQKKSMTDAVIFDAVCDALIETAADKCEEEIKAKAAEEGFDITFRYSPGYGDLPIETQPDIIAALSADKRIGLTVTETFLLLPRKSITALIGLERRNSLG